MKASFAGTIQFGAVHISIKAYPVVASSEEQPTFRELHRPCRTPTQRVVRCPTCQTEPTGEELIRGIQDDKGWLTFERDEIQAQRAQPEDGRPITIRQVSPLAQVHPLWYDRAYHLVPLDDSFRAYGLLSQVLRTTHTGAVVTFVSYGQDRLGIIRPTEEGLVLQTLHFATSLRSLQDCGTGTKTEFVEPSREEARLAKLLSVKLRSRFVYQGYIDTTKHRVEALITAKRSGKRLPTVVAPPATPGNVISLRDALRHSIHSATHKTKRPAKAKHG